MPVPRAHFVDIAKENINKQEYHCKRVCPTSSLANKEPLVNKPKSFQPTVVPITQRTGTLRRSHDGRTRRVTRRVSGVRTPKPYKSTRYNSLAHVLLPPGDGGFRSSLHQNTTQDTIDSGSCPLVPQYEDDVLSYMLEVECRYLACHTYIANHPSVNQHSRSILVDWLIQVVSYLELDLATLHQSVSVVDRVLSLRCVPIHRVQLLALAALLVISKLEEKTPPEVQSLLELSLNYYTRPDLLALEKEVLCNLNFELVHADPSLFLRYFLYLTCNSYDQLIIEASGFLLELVLVEIWPMGTRPSILGAAALYGALWVLKDRLAAQPVITLMPDYFRINIEELIGATIKMLETLSNRFSSPYQGAQVKYASRSRHCSVAQHVKMEPEFVRNRIDHLQEFKIRMCLQNSSISENKMINHTAVLSKNDICKQRLQHNNQDVYSHSYLVTDV